MALAYYWTKNRTHLSDHIQLTSKAIKNMKRLGGDNPPLALKRKLIRQSHSLKLLTQRVETLRRQIYDYLSKVIYYLVRISGDSLKGIGYERNFQGGSTAKGALGRLVQGMIKNLSQLLFQSGKSSGFSLNCFRNN